MPKHLKPLTLSEENEIVRGWRTQFLRNKDTASVINKVVAIALDDEHKHQATALKLVWDKVLRDEDKRDPSAKPSIKIEISTYQPENPVKDISVIEGEVDG